LARKQLTVAGPIDKKPQTHPLENQKHTQMFDHRRTFAFDVASTVHISRSMRI
jgi:hypothetical protein